MAENVGSALEMNRAEDSHVGIIPSGGGTPIQITSDRDQSYPHDWSPDGGKILFAGLRNGHWNVWWASRQDKTEKQTTNYSKVNTYDSAIVHGRQAATRSLLSTQRRQVVSTWRA